MRNMEENKYIRKGNTIIWSGPAELKSTHCGTVGNIKEIQDHEHSISEESREEMHIDKP